MTVPVPVLAVVAHPDDADFGRDVVAAVEAQLATLPRADVARASWQNFGAVIFVDHLDQAPTLVDRLAVATRRR